ncbi:sialic acid-binding Ig-like lectin 15 [Heterodontus francisci]|uniref:sialic acid-binding Ig-like lectin 15 n=1 Tax=Heterodontus francisci TaxID=7792 RepID=UPI00355BC5AD
MKALSLLLPVLLAVLSSGSDRVSVSVEVPRRVDGSAGNSVVLPCKFRSSYADYTTFDITVIWKMKVFYTGPVLFNSTNRLKTSKIFENVVHTNINGRYRLAGDPRKKDASLELKNAMLDDNSEYFCRVEVKRQGLPPYMDETNPGTILKITGPPAILNVSIQTINDTQFTIVCIAQGEPSPNIMWIDPQNNRIPMNGSNTPVMRGPEKYQIIGRLHDPKLGGNYSCVATNDRGNVTHTIYFTSFNEQWRLLKIIICASAGGLCLIILIVIVVMIWRRKRGTATFTPQAKSYQPDSSTYCKVKLYQQQSTPESTCNAAESPEMNNQ